jgi:hypothetical protein
MVHKLLDKFNKDFKTKIESLINKSDQYKSPIGLKRNPHHSRVGWKYEHVKQFMKDNNISNEDSLSKLFPNGIIIELWNETYFQLRDGPNLDELDKFILKQVQSSDSLVRSVVIGKSIDSGKTNYSELIKKIRESQELIPIKCKVSTMKHTSTQTQSSNSLWEGNLSVDIKGGSKKTESTYKTGNALLVNAIWDYASKEDTESIEVFMIYSALCCKDGYKLLKNPEDYEKIKEQIRVECLEKNLLNIEDFGEGCPFDKDGNLVCCISGDEIKADDIFGKNEGYTVQACHITAKSESNVFIKNEKIQTSFRPYNIAWGYEFWNRAQNNLDIKDFKEKVMKCARFR